MFDISQLMSLLWVVFFQLFARWTVRSLLDPTRFLLASPSVIPSSLSLDFKHWGLSFVVYHV